MLMEGRSAVEEQKATRKIVRLTIRHPMRIVCLQIVDIRLPQTWRTKSHPHIRFYGLWASENITRPCPIERPTSNLTIPSGFFFFHRGLPFFKRGHSNKLHWSIHVSTHMHPHLYAMFRCRWYTGRPSHLQGHFASGRIFSIVFGVHPEMKFASACAKTPCAQNALRISRRVAKCMSPRRTRSFGRRRLTNFRRRPHITMRHHSLTDFADDTLQLKCGTAFLLVFV